MYNARDGPEDEQSISIINDENVDIEIVEEKEEKKKGKRSDKEEMDQSQSEEEKKTEDEMDIDDDNDENVEIEQQQKKKAMNLDQNDVDQQKQKKKAMNIDQNDVDQQKLKIIHKRVMNIYKKIGKQKKLGKNEDISKKFKVFESKDWLDRQQKLLNKAICPISMLVKNPTEEEIDKYKLQTKAKLSKGKKKKLKIYSKLKISDEDYLYEDDEGKLKPFTAFDRMDFLLKQIMKKYAKKIGYKNKKELQKEVDQLVVENPISKQKVCIYKNY